MQPASTCLRFACAIAILTTCGVAQAQPTADELAKSLSNPVAALISVPFQLNYDSGFGPDGNGTRTTLNVQPVVPVSLNDHWNLISRTILPVISQHDVGVRGASDSGLGDIVQSVFISPKAPTASGWIWGAGPVLLLPTGSASLTTNQWAAGPTGVMLKQIGPYTVGLLANHLWGVSGHGNLPSNGLPDINATFVQPFISKAVGKGATVAANVEGTYDWNRNGWSLPANLTYSQVLPIGKQLISIGGGVRAYLASPGGGPDWGLRLSVTLLYPK